jgi:hypothetical protein
LSEKVLGIEYFDIEIDYQDQSIGKYDLDFNGNDFVLLNKKNSLFGSRSMGISSNKNEMIKETNSCTPGGSCC